MQRTVLRLVSESEYSATERSKKMKWMTVLCSVVCALATGCESDHGKDTEVGTLAGTKWQAAAWSASSLDPARFTITSDFDESRISGTSAVNAYGGSYTATDDGSFSVGELQSTLMGGSDDAMRAESLYFDLLRQARRYVLSGATLTLKDAGNQDILVFQAR
jgi:heat shock protein HslJ